MHIKFIGITKFKKMKLLRYSQVTSRRKHRKIETDLNYDDDDVKKLAEAQSLAFIV